LCDTICSPSVRYLLSLSSLVRPPLTSTLFPYTTLFRSTKYIPFTWYQLRQKRSKLLHFPWQLTKKRSRHKAMERRCIFSQITCQDRKSTRLNSSHLVISYAVFCLKKKTHSTHSLRFSST